MKLIKLTLLVGVMTFLYGCEKCSDCTLSMYDGTCSFEFFGTTIDQEYTNLTEDENRSVKSNCQASGGIYTEDEMVTEKEECGKKKDVEDAVDDREDDGYDCSSIE